MMKNKMILFVSVIMLFVLCGCGASKDSYSSVAGSINMDGYNGGYEMSEESWDIGYDDMDYADISSPSANINSSIQEAANSHKLVKKYYIDAESKVFDDTLDKLYAKIAELGGYIENSEISGNSYSYSMNRTARLVIRIPAENTNSFIELVKTEGNVTNYSEEVTDITLDYVDTQSHIEALNTEKETLLGMLEKAEDIDTLLIIQNELTNVRYELEFYESMIRTYDQQVEYSTITLDLDEVLEITEQIGQETFFEEMGRKFMDNTKGMFEFIKDLIILIVSSLPIIIPLVAVIGGFVYVVLLIDKKNRKKLAAEKKEKVNKVENE